MEHKRGRRRFVIFLKILSFFVVVIGLVSATILWPIKKISCVSQYGPCSSEIDELLKADRVSHYKLNKFIKERVGLSEKVSSYDYQLIFPFEARVRIIENKAEVAIQLDEGGKYYFYTKTGVRLGEGEKTELPIIKLRGTVGESELNYATEILSTLFVSHGVSELTLSENIISFFYKEYDIIFPVRGDIDKLLGAFEITLSWLNTNSENTKISVIDFRYENPVLK